MVKCGGDENATWTAMDEHEMKRLHDFRHTVPETVNLVIDERRKKEASSDEAGHRYGPYPSASSRKSSACIMRQLDSTSLQYVMFGHIGNNHIHVNILPASLQDYELGQNLYLEWAREVIDMGGTVLGRTRHW